MSRRPPPPDRSEQNRATLKQLVKLETNKSCADCKRNKHPRWASWNIGVFICIRCSGIHRSMGVHISRVKSVDLDTWTDEQMASILRWGNARANKYWEHKLAAGHVPNEAKIENFIRTKYNSKRWVMDGPMPDPSTLDDGGADDDVPLNVVQEKAKLERGANLGNGGRAGIGQPPPPRARPQEIDLFGDAAESAPVRPNTTEPASAARVAPSKAAAAPPRQTKPGESLLGLDFFGGAQSAPPRPSSAASGLSTPGVPGRSDLKNSILSLYASAPKPAAPAAAPSNASQFGGMQSPPLASPTQSSQSNTASLGGLGDAFSSLSFSTSTANAPSAKPQPFSNLSSPTSTTHNRQTSSLSGGSFFDAKPTPPPKPNSPPSQTRQSGGFADFGDFNSASPPPASTRSPPSAAAASSMGDLFDLSPPAPAPTPAAASKPPPISAAKYTAASAFNLSTPHPTQATTAPVQAQTQASNFSALSNADAWGSNDAWATPDPAPAAPSITSSAPAPPPQTSSSTFKAPAAAPVISSATSGWGDSGGWDDPEPAPVKPAANSTSTSGQGFSVQQDEEFGGWSHASPVATSASAKPPGLSSNTDDLFGNVWG